MLAVFEKAIANPPKELGLPFGGSGNRKTKEEFAVYFGSDQPDSTCYKSIVVMDDIFCIFNGYLRNVCDLRRHYGLSRQATEAMVVVEAYKVLRDRAPYPADQVIKELDGKFSFILFDAKATHLFLARGCGNRYTPFPPGCFFTTEEGLISFDHPFNKVQGVVREDDGGYGSAVIFQVDLFTRLHSIPRRGSDANWTGVIVVEGDYE
ncbi:protein of unknown function DUF3700 [Cynara cardunculus var. scolymus]|uniref:DUF3700 domain-containing protein n=1 Tax=Cynara cardunculus var. scolymus TaxID=59895 RepID=A0A124SB51_CYNCS|nr:protein of unknown function DUF3700 [Cynara cardunculus var. scolymus]